MNLFFEMNFQNLLSSLIITFLKVLSLNLLSPINSILPIEALSPKLILIIKSTVSLLFSKIWLSISAK